MDPRPQQNYPIPQDRDMRPQEVRGSTRGLRIRGPRMEDIFRQRPGNVDLYQQMVARQNSPRPQPIPDATPEIPENPDDGLDQFIKIEYVTIRIWDFFYQSRLM